jgi:hypothetical protein
MYARAFTQSAGEPQNGEIYKSFLFDQLINRGLGVTMLVMGVRVTIRTGWGAPHSASWFTRVPTAGLAQYDSSPEVAR